MTVGSINFENVSRLIVRKFFDDFKHIGRDSFENFHEFGFEIDPAFLFNNLHRLLRLEGFLVRVFAGQSVKDVKNRPI